MKTQLRIPLEKLNWDLFCKRGAVMACFDRDQLVLGMGEDLGEGEFKFFQQDFFNQRRWEYVPEIICLVNHGELRGLEKATQRALVEGNEDEIYLRDLNRALEAFDENFKKVVLISREFYSKRGISFKKLLTSLLGGELGYHYGMWDEKGGMLGSTPEVLLSKKGEEFESMALASTRPYERKEELLSDSKELYEHKLVIEDIKNKLAKQEELVVGKTGIQKFGKLAHLRTDVSFKSRDNFVGVANRLSPTAALGGYPKELAKNFIQSSDYYQNHPDRKYGGSIGIEIKEDAFALVAIRNIQWDEQNYWIECGGGVVPESTVENELAEVRKKRGVIRELFFGDNPQ